MVGTSQTSRTSIISPRAPVEAPTFRAPDVPGVEPEVLRYLGWSMRRTPDVVAMGKEILAVAKTLWQSDWKALYPGASIERNIDPAVLGLSAAAFRQASRPGGDRRRNRTFSHEPVNPVLASVGDLATRYAIVVYTAGPEVSEPLERCLTGFEWRSYAPVPGITRHQMLVGVDDPDNIIARAQRKVENLGYTKDARTDATDGPYEQPSMVVLNVNVPTGVALPDELRSSVEERLSRSMLHKPVIFEPFGPVFAGR